MKCSECSTNIIEIEYTDEQGKKQVMYAHGDTTKTCTLRNDGIDVKVTDQKMSNIYSAMITEQIKEMGEQTVELNSEASSSNSIRPQQSPSPFNRIEVIKDRLAKGELDILSFDEVKKRIETK